MPRRDGTNQKEIPGYVARNLSYYLDKESKGDEEASRIILEISNRWGI
jgi:hypothetical protein